MTRRTATPGPRSDPRSSTGARVALPLGARPPIVVYVNGTEQVEGVDYTLGPDGVRFSRPLRRPGERFWHRAVQTIAGIGIYNQGDAVDMHYVDVDGSPRVATHVAVAFAPRA